GPDQHLYQSAAMIVNVFVAIPAAFQHHRAGAIRGYAVSRLLPLTILFAVVGVLLSELQVFHGQRGEPFLRIVFGGFLFFVVLTDLYRIVRRWLRQDQPRASSHQGQQAESGNAVTTGGHVRWLQASLVAFPTGLVAGMLGVGGGAVMVPLQRKVLSMPLTSAIANSAAVIIGTAFIGAIVKNAAYAQSHALVQSLYLAAILIPTAIFGSLIGSRLTHRLPVGAIKFAFLILLSVVAIRLTSHAVAQWREAEHLPTTSQQAFLADPPQGPYLDRFV
ncbi:MAG: sulfite exporter TauE/SafE family protein, partial [Phycisphaerae bacterium]